MCVLCTCVYLHENSTFSLSQCFPLHCSHHHCYLSLLSLFPPPMASLNISSFTTLIANEDSDHGTHNYNLEYINTQYKLLKKLGMLMSIIVCTDWQLIESRFTQGTNFLFMLVNFWIRLIEIGRVSYLKYR